jgi:hypothetical protein
VQRQDDICDRVRTLAYTDRTLMADDACNMLPLSEWPQALRDCVEGIEVVIQHVDAGDGHTARVVKLKMSSKLDAAREVARIEERLWRLHDAASGQGLQEKLSSSRAPGRVRR